MNINKIIYWIATAILCLLMAFSASMYFMKTEMVMGFFTTLGYPTYLVYPLATAKILGIIAILSRKSPLLKEWAYAGFFFDTVLAFFAHYMIGDGQGGMAAVGIIVVIVSRFFEEKAFSTSNTN